MGVGGIGHVTGNAQRGSLRSHAAVHAVRMKLKRGCLAPPIARSLTLEPIALPSLCISATGQGLPHSPNPLNTCHVREHWPLNG